MNIPNHVFADFVATFPTVPSPSSSVAWMNVPLGLPTVHEHPHICSAFVPFLRKWRIIQILTENQNDTTACLPLPPTHPVPCRLYPWVFLHSRPSCCFTEGFQHHPARHLHAALPQVEAGSLWLQLLNGLCFRDQPMLKG